MPHIDIPSGLPGITGLLEARLDSAEPIRELTQTILRGPNTLTEGERELLASIVCERNACRFCTAAHVTTAARYVGSVPVVRKILADPHGGHVNDRVAALLDIAAAVQRTGRDVTPELIDAARRTGATDTEIHDAVLIAALFAFYNRYVDGLATDLPATEDYFDALADRLSTAGYVRRPQHGTH